MPYAATTCEKEISMNLQELNLRKLFALLGLLFVVASVGAIFLAPGTFWNWGLLLVALVFLFLSRRAA